MTPGAGSARLLVAAALALVTLLAGCSSGGNTVAGQAAAGGGTSYVAGDGTVQTITPGDRTTTISVRGRSLDGTPIDTASYRGQVVVINTWGSWCPPCNAEAPVLQRTWAGFEGRGVQFVGVDQREGPAAGQAFQRKFTITYPSLQWDGGGALLQLKGKAPATPTTLVVDALGRLAGRISGPTKGSTLRDMIQEVLDAPADQGGRS